MEHVKFFKLESGCIMYLWVGLPGRPAVCMGRAEDKTTEEEAVRRAEAYWKREDRIKEIAVELQIRHPGRQVYTGFLPSDDLIFDGEFGEYVYILKNRRRSGKYQIEEAIRIE